MAIFCLPSEFLTEIWREQVSEIYLFIVGEGLESRRSVSKSHHTTYKQVFDLHLVQFIQRLVFVMSSKIMYFYTYLTIA